MLTLSDILVLKKNSSNKTINYLILNRKYIYSRLNSGKTIHETDFLKA